MPPQPRDVTDLPQHTSSCPTPSTADDDATAAGQSIPPRRQAPPLPAGVMTEEMGRKYCRELCNLYPEIFDGQKGHFKGVQAELFIKEGHEELLKKKGVRPPAKVPYGLIDQYNEKLDKMLENMQQVNGQDISVASQIVPVCETKDGKKTLKRLAVNYKSTINDHLEDMPEAHNLQRQDGQTEGSV